MNGYNLTKEQARVFMLLKQGLIGDYKFKDKQGVYEFVKQASCLQYDPIDVCGKNAELVLQSRVKNFSKSMLSELLYTDRKLVDYFDKNLAIFASDDWPYFQPIRDSFSKQGRSKEIVDELSDKVKNIIKEKQYVVARDLEFNETIDWYWSPTTLGRALLESLYFRGDLIIHHKKGTLKYYSIAEDYLPNDLINADYPFSNNDDYLKWRIYRRIGALGLLWDKPSDALMFIPVKGLKRSEIFEQGFKKDELVKIKIDGNKADFYCLKEDESLLNQIINGDYKITYRVELLAPLDNMLWDRKLIKYLFDYDYKWEIYTPEAQRKYGYYVLPLLYKDELVGRIEVVNDKKSKTLNIKNIWFETNFKPTTRFYASLNKCLVRFAKFNECDKIIGKILGDELL